MYPPSSSQADGFAPDETPTDPTAMPVDPMRAIPLDDKELSRWKADIERSAQRIENIKGAWERQLTAYTPDYSDKWGGDINPGKDFYQVEQKKPQLFYETPYVVLAPPEGVQVDPQTAAAIQQEQLGLNRDLGRDVLNVKRMVDKVLFDVLCPAGVGPSKLGFTNITRDVPAPPDPLTHQAPMDKTGQPVMVPVPVFQELFWERFSPLKLLIPTNFFDTDWDKAPWLGMKFSIPRRIAKAQWRLPADLKGVKSSSDQDVFKYQNNAAGMDSSEDDDLITGQEIWYKAAYYDDQELDPRKFRQLVLVDGLDEPAVHRDSPYQKMDPQTGSLTPDSMIGNPIHPLTIRDLADSAYIPSDCMMTRPLVNELVRYRTQLTEHRDSSTSVRLGDPAILTPEILAKVVRGPYGSIIMVPGLNTSNPPVVEVSHPVYSHENFQGQDIIEGDIEKVSAIGANQSGAQQDTVRSATELSIIQQASNTRLTAERNRVIAWFLGGVRKVDCLRQLLMRGADQQASPALGRYTYDIKPDSGVHMDAAVTRKQALDTYNQLRQDPNLDHVAFLKEILPLLHLDPSMVKPPPPTPPKPPDVSFSVKGDDLNPLAPQYANVVTILAKYGIVLQPAAPLPVQPSEHPGSAPRADLVDQHAADITGHLEGGGGLAPANLTRNPMQGGLH